MKTTLTPSDRAKAMVRTYGQGGAAVVAQRYKHLARTEVDRRFWASVIERLKAQAQ